MPKGVSPTNKIEDEDLLEDLKKTSEKVEGEITCRKYTEKGKYTFQTIASRFGGWHKAKRKANVGGEKLSEEDLLKDLKRVSEIIDGEEVKRRQYEKYGNHSVTSFLRTVGGWNKAKKKAGIKTTRMGQPRIHRGIFDGDGSVGKYEKGLQTTFHSNSEKLIDQIMEGNKVDILFIFI